jgi:DNA-binding transcriptional MerR regulator
MRATDKVFFTSAVIRAAGCSSETFRSWRNRNGLFPETQDAEGWNRFSVVDILAVAIVSTLTDAGLTAQVAVDAAKEAAPILTKAIGNKRLCNNEKPDLQEVMFGLSDRLVERDELVLAIELRGHDMAEVSLLPRNSLAEHLLEKSAVTVVVSITHLIVAISALWLEGADVEVRPGATTTIEGQFSAAKVRRKK